MTSDRQVGRTAVTDDDGRFSFVALPAGRYMLYATKQGYVTTAYGAKRPNRPGTALVLADGQHIDEPEHAPDARQRNLRASSSIRMASRSRAQKSTPCRTVSSATASARSCP